MAWKRWVSRRLFAAGGVLLAISLGLGGCKKEGQGKPADDDKSKLAAAEKSEPAQKIMAESGAKAPGKTLAPSDLAVFPADTEFVLSVSVGSARKSALWKSYGKLATKDLYEDGDFKQFMKVCGFDPVENIDTFVIGGNTASEKGVMVIKGFTKAEVKTCADKLAAVEGGKVVVEGNLLGVDDGDTKLWAGWIDDETLVACTDVSDRKYLEKRLSGASGIHRDTAFMDLVKNVDRGATAWFAMLPREGSPVTEGLAQAPTGAPLGIFGSASLDGGLTVDVGARFKKEAEATQASNLAQAMMPELKKEAGPFAKFVDKLSFGVKNRDVIIQVKLSETELAALISEAMSGLEAAFGH